MAQFQINFAKLLASKQVKDEKRVISLTEVSEATNIAYTTLQRWERGDITRIDFPVVEALCTYFECKMSDLIQYIPPQSSQRFAETAVATAQIAVVG